MLLRLTLALLWSTCWAAQMYGTGGGSYFSTSTDHENEITGIRVTLGSLGILRRVQVRYGPSWTSIHGSKLPGTQQEFILYPGEHIIRISGFHKVFLRSLKLYTDIGRYVTFGVEDGVRFDTHPDQIGTVLTGICGQYKFLGITSLCFAWDYPLENWLTAEESNCTSPGT